VSELEAIRQFYRFNSRMRRKYLSALLALSPEERLKDRGASYGSLQEVYVHVLDGLRWWMEFVPQARVEEASTYPAREMTDDQLRAETDKVDRLAFNFIDSLVESDLRKEIVLQYVESGKEVVMRFPTSDLLWHEVEEELQHRGEMNALLWQMNLEPPIGMVEDWNAAKSPSDYLK
jgi:uncharacterized damage-inducible protein DinB